MKELCDIPIDAEAAKESIRRRLRVTGPTYYYRPRAGRKTAEYLYSAETDEEGRIIITPAKKGPLCLTRKEARILAEVIKNQTQ